MTASDWRVERAAGSAATLRLFDRLQLAEAVLVEAGASGAGVSEGDVARYWTALIQANRDRLVDPANPDLIFADQVLLLPPRAGSLR